MIEAISDEAFLLAVLNSTPVIDGVPADDLADPARARAWLASAGRCRDRDRTAARAGGPARAAGGRARRRTAGRAGPAPGGHIVDPRPDGRPDHLDAQRPGRSPAGGPRCPVLGHPGQDQPRAASSLRERRMPALPRRSHQGRHRPVVLDGGLRQPDESPAALPAGPAGYDLGWVKRMGLPKGSRRPQSIPYGRSVGSSVNSTPRPSSVSYVLRQSSVAEDERAAHRALGHQLADLLRRLLGHRRRPGFSSRIWRSG